jgi:valyl-tRNA synthetase
MDTWATSSLTPQIASRWEEDPDLFARVFPMDVRPQAHDIIRTWLFDTVLRSHFEFDSLPWKHAAISGWVLDPDRKKMSKSKGNVVTPMGLLEEHGSDGVRYWAASGRSGTDTAFDTGQMKVGRRLAIKLLNASRFVLAKPEVPGSVTAAVDRGLLTTLARIVHESTADLEDFNYTRVLERTETFFWSFCDDYLELVKGRRYGDQGTALAASANGALLTALSTMLRLFAPFLPFVTEEVWSWWREGSIHRSTWPTTEEVLAPCGGVEDNRGVDSLQFAATVLSAIRKKKSEEQRPLKTPVAKAVVHAPDALLVLLPEVESDLRASGLIQQLGTAKAETLHVDVELAPPELSREERSS